MVRLICWDAESLSERRSLLENAGLVLDTVEVEPSKLITHIRRTQPDTVVIDLDRRPSHGREVAMVLRTSKSTRAIPLVFLGGASEKVAKVRSELPDAIYGAWDEASATIRKVRQLEAPVVPVPHMLRWDRSSLEKKLELAKGPVAAIGAPEGLLEGLATRITAKTRLAIWFIRSREQLEREMDFMALHPPLWVAFPKQTGRFRADFNQHDVRKTAVAAGLVDNKVCAIDDDWSAIRFARRR